MAEVNYPALKDRACSWRMIVVLGLRGLYFIHDTIRDLAVKLIGMIENELYNQ
jgi:hypothetical protein